MRFIIFAFSSLFTINLVWADQLSFPAVWQQINHKSAAQESSRLQTQSLFEANRRASRHWLPKLYIDVRSYQTNDPGASFFGLIEQRALEQNDLSTQAINHPDTQLYTRSSVGLDLPLFEGGMRYSEEKATKHALSAQESATAQVQLSQYSQVGESYAAIGVIEKLNLKLQDLKNEVDKLIKSYQLGNRSNPVGYSGLLGMKTLSNRLSGLINQYEAQKIAHYAQLKEMGLQRADWSPTSINSVEFADQYLRANTKNNDQSTSYNTRALRENVSTYEKFADMQRAKFLPRVGAFAESSLFKGDRDTASGYTAGVYIRWNIFDPADYGSLSEARLKASAVNKSAEHSEQQERATQVALNQSIKVLKENIELLNDSEKLLIEQSRVTATLFKNGSISALQFVEILSRRTDLLVQKGEAEMNLIKSAAQALVSTTIDIEKLLTANEGH